jgi:hypothetical protein
MDENTARRDIWEAARANDHDRLFALTYDLDWGYEGPAPEGPFRLLIEALDDPEFVASPAAHCFLEAFEQNVLVLGRQVQRLQGAQHSELLRAMERAFPGAEKQLRFEIGVILGEALLDRAALDVLRRLRAVPGFEARDTVAHSLQHFAVQSPDIGLRNEATSALRAMADDPDPRVRANVADWLRNVHEGRTF